jgi:hypothetical protein
MTAPSAIGYCVELTGAELDDLKDWLAEPDRVRQMEFATDADGLRIKVNYGTWSPPLGTVTGAPR